jgi:hypothetical protein
VDARKHDLAVSAGRQPCHRFPDALRRSAAAPAADRGDDAVGTGPIAAVLDLEEGPGPRPRGGNLRPAPRPAVQGGFGQALLFGVGDDPPDAGHPGQVVRGPLGQTAGDDDARAGAVRSRLADEFEGLAVGPGGQGAGVDDDEISTAGLGGRPQAAALEVLGPGEGFGLVDPAAEAADGERGHIFSWSFLELASTFSAIFFR